MRNFPFRPVIEGAAMFFRTTSWRPKPGTLRIVWPDPNREFTELEGNLGDRTVSDVSLGNWNAKLI
jgi:hypothetical protein